MIFQRDEITIQEYLLIRHIISSRAHQVGVNHFLIPLFHYSNQKDEILISDERIQIVFKRKFIMIENSIKDFEPNEEVLYYYGFESVYQYAFYGGFVPKKFEYHCIKVEFMDQTTSQLTGLPQQACINDKNLKANLMVGKIRFMEQTQLETFKKCEFWAKNKVFKDESEKYSQMYENCKDFVIDKKILLNKVLNPIKQPLTEKLFRYNDLLTDLERYMYFRQKNNKNVQNIKIFKNLIQFLITSQQDALLLIEQQIEYL